MRGAPQTDISPGQRRPIVICRDIGSHEAVMALFRSSGIRADGSLIPYCSIAYERTVESPFVGNRLCHMPGEWTM
jgi:hypothetical protein